MKPVNKYAKSSKISEDKFRSMVKCFASDLNASQTSEITGINRNTVNRYFNAIRGRISEICSKENPFNGNVEVDESYFGPKRIRGKRGRGAYGKTIVFGLLKRGDKVYTEIVPDASRKTLQGIIRGHVDPESVIHSDGWKGYDGLVDIGYDKHFRVNHGANEFVNDRNHINGIESFWSFAKMRLAQFHGVRKDKFLLHLKECEYRFNHRKTNLYKLLLKIFRDNSLF
jgi:transposase-like protein